MKFHIMFRILIMNGMCLFSVLEDMLKHKQIVLKEGNYGHCRAPFRPRRLLAV